MRSTENMLGARYEVRIVCSGLWTYDGAVELPVDIVALEFDWWYELVAAEDGLQQDEKPKPVGPDGCLYYVRFRRGGEITESTWVDSGGFVSVEEAKQHAESRLPSAVDWQRTV